MENSNRCTKCNGKNTTKMLKYFSLKFQQSYKSYWGNKRGRTKRMRNTKFLFQELDLGIPSQRGEFDWWDYRSRSPLSFPKRMQQDLNGGEKISSSQDKQQWKRARGRRRSTKEREKKHALKRGQKICPLGSARTASVLPAQVAFLAPNG